MAELRLEQRLALKQILTPQLIQSLNLLILPRLELEQALKQEIEENPFLEAKEEGPSTNDKDEETLAEWQRFFDGLRLFPSVSEEIDESELETSVNREALVPETETLFEHLRDQIELVFSTEREKSIALEIIGNLDERGFLNLELSEIRDALIKAGLTPPPTEDEIEYCRKKVMELDPAGVGARDLRESFLAQLKAKELGDTLAYEIVKDHFDLLLNGNFKKIKQELNITDEDLFIALTDIRGLRFSPAADYGIFQPPIVPEISFEKIDGEWVVIYNRSAIPRLNINKAYLDLLRNRKTLDDKTRSFLRDKFERAKAWMKALVQREETIVKLGYEILARQREFFENGLENLKPMTMEELASSLGVHTSTVHRIVKDKYAQTPYGLLPLKFFFSRGYKDKKGGEISSRAVKEKIKELIENEDKRAPLSDEEISRLLSEMGLNVARRTVAKYRESMGILPARLRKGFL